MKRILVVIGTRPEAIKLAPVVHALEAMPGSFQTRVCLSGQHREMLHQAVEHFRFRVDFDIDLRRESQTLAGLTAALVGRLDGVVADCRPDLLLVQGDTTSALAGALVGSLSKVQVGHVEAGLRSDDKFTPYPEEINRRLVGVVADHHFAPTDGARDALLREGVDESRVLVTGNTVVDALLYTLKKIDVSPPSLGDLDSVVESGRKIVLITGHRRESFGDGFRRICEAIRDLSQRFVTVAFVYPVHLNPNVQEPVFRLLGDLENVHLTAPVGYEPFVRLMKAAHIILTDSGGIQEEAPTLAKPVLVMRDLTERPEAVAAGNALLVGTDRAKIVREATTLLEEDSAWQAMSTAGSPFGDGHAAERIVGYLAALDSRQTRC